MKKTARLAADVGVLPSNVRYYVRQGLLRPAATSEGGQFLFDETAEERLRAIVALRDQGVSLPEIREHLREATQMLPLDTVLDFWNLREHPFQDLPRIEYFYKSRQHVEAYDRIIDGVLERNLSMIQITGEVGTGKTLTSKMIEQTLADLRDTTDKDKPLFLTVFVERPYENWPSLLDFIVETLAPGIDTDGGKIEKSERAYRQITQGLRQKNQRLLIILDDIQLYDDDTLEKATRLTSTNDNEHNWVSLLFIGQATQAREKVARLMAIFSRIKVKHYFNNLMYDDLLRYITFRMLVAGHKPFGKPMAAEDFAKLANEADKDPKVKAKKEWERIAATTPFYKFRSDLYVATGGMPRQTNTACSRMLELAAERGELEISPETFHDVIKELELHQPQVKEATRKRGS